MPTRGERIREAQKATGLTVISLVGKLGVTKQGYYKWVRNEVEDFMAGHLVELSQLSGYNPAWIMTGRGPKMSKTSDKVLMRIHRALEALNDADRLDVLDYIEFKTGRIKRPDLDDGVLDVKPS